MGHDEGAEKIFETGVDKSHFPRKKKEKKKKVKLSKTGVGL